MTQQSSYLIIGQGKIGTQVSNQLAKQDHKVTGMARGSREQYELSSQVAFVQADATKLTAKQIYCYTHIAIIVTPTRTSTSTHQDYRDSYLAIAKQLASVQTELTQLKRLVFISSTGVYGQNAGEWIDELTVPHTPERLSSQIIYQAEQVLQSAFADNCVIIRPSGIYGTSRLMRIRKARELANSPMANQAWTNRIMDTDLVNIIVKVLTMADPKPMYLATDYRSCTSFELTSWLCEHLNIDKPIIDKPIIDKPIIDKPSIEQQINPSGKRIHSNIPLDWLRYPDWQSGYRMILKSLTKD